jgi:hypothetical protein
MRAQTLTEFAEDMRRKGDIRQSDLADEILTLIDIESDVAEPYSELCADLENDAPADIKDKPEKVVEWLVDRSHLLEEIEKHFADAGRDKTGTDDVADMVRELLGTMKAAEAILEEHGWPGTDFLDALENLAENTPTPKEYDL